MTDSFPSDYPATSSIAEAMREMECISGVRWCYERTYKLRFDATAATEQIEAVLDEIETECGLTPTDDQPRGRGVLVRREFVDIEID